MLCRCGATQRPVNSVLVVVIPKSIELLREVDPIPEKRAIQEFAADRADQSFHERVRNGGVRNGLDLPKVEHAQIGKPPVEAVQRVVIGADAFRRASLTRDPKVRRCAALGRAAQQRRDLLVPAKATGEVRLWVDCRPSPRAAIRQPDLSRRGRPVSGNLEAGRMGRQSAKSGHPTSSMHSGLPWGAVAL